MKTKLLTICLLLIGLSLYSQKFFVVDTKYIMEKMPEYNSAQSQIDQLSTDWQNEIQNKYNEVKDMYKKFQAEAILLPEDMKTKREDEIIRKEEEIKRLQNQYFGKDGELQKKRMELIKPIQDKIYNAIQKVATRGAYAAVFDKSSQTSILFLDEKIDKSNDILTELGISID